MSFIRPEARAALQRWREALIGVAVALVGLSWITGPGGLLGWLGWAMIPLGAVLVFIGIQRARFRTGGAGPGVVNVDEGQISYFGPLTGGAVAARDLERLTLDPSLRPAHWVLTQPGVPPLYIPVTAEGAEALFDVFSALPGIRTERMLAQLQGGSALPVVIWEKTPSRPPGLPLH